MFDRLQIILSFALNHKHVTCSRTTEILEGDSGHRSSVVTLHNNFIDYLQDFILNCIINGHYSRSQRQQDLSVFPT